MAAHSTRAQSHESSQRVEQEESRVQVPNSDPAGNEGVEGEPVFSADAARIPEERLLRNDQGPQGQAES